MSIEPTVFVVEDNPSVREYIRSLVEREGFAAETFATAEDFLKACDPCRPGCIVLDLRMPGISGEELQLLLKQRGCTIPVIIVTGHADVSSAVRTFRAGALDLLEKPFRGQTLLASVRKAIELDSKYRQFQEDREAFAFRAETLTPRETEVLERIVTGMPNREIAHQFNISVKTVEIHRSRVMKKMGTRSAVDLTRLYYTTRSPLGLPNSGDIEEPLHGRSSLDDESLA